MAKKFLQQMPAAKLGIGLSLLAILVLVAIFAPMFSTDAANKLTDNTSLSPSWHHPLGTNDFGQDTMARTLVATRLTLLMTLGASLIALVGGLLLGVGVWLAPVRIREVSLRLLETAVAYPTLITALVIAAILQPGVATTIFAIGIAGIPGFARVTANLTQSVSKSEFVVSAKLLGVGPYQLASRHILPNMAEPLLVLSTTVFASILVEISALSFIGLGVQSPDYDFGRLLNDSLAALYTQPIEALGPSVMIVITGISMMLVGDALAARSNPRMRFGSMAQKKTTQVPTTRLAKGDSALVRVENLRICVPNGSELVKGVSLHLNPGEVVALVGESGSGKSLTAMAIAGLASRELHQEASVLRVDDMNMLANPDPSRLAREISVIYQDPGTTFNPSLRMGAQLTEVLRTHLGQSKHEAISNITTALERVGITHPASRLRQHPHQLSGGMRQRAMIAMGIVNKPRLIVADEPTTALDVTVQLEVLRQFREIHAQSSTAILFISHDLGVVQELCDRILVMKSGQIVEELGPEQLKTKDVQHPYTKSLLEAVAVLDLGDKTSLQATGSVVDSRR